MKTVGLIGGITWASTLEYYRSINRETARRLGGVHSARIALLSLEFHEVRERTLAGDEDGVYAIFVDAAAKLKAAGADFLVLCANTAHKRAERLQQDSGLPLVHIGDATGAAIRQAGFTKVGLLGTRPTMEETFMRSKLEAGYGLDVQVPAKALRDDLNGFIYGEMAAGVFSDAARALVDRATAELVAQGAQGIVHGCTELPILMRGRATPCPAFDTTELHAAAAVDYALS
jgi:aspartate racemase